MQNDSTKQEKLKCEDGFEPCKTCEGCGWVPINENPNCEYARPCLMCYGEGVVDWVKIIMGECNPKREAGLQQAVQWPIKPNLQ
ncbi:MAG TPA: hypothetical protein VMX17_08495 [Candidatus Glassbacteria bacterium]|nr:hypothetical protein [Candidatus Glassbacteria bacterium]